MAVVAALTVETGTRDPSRPGAYAGGMSDDDVPRELRGVSPDPTREPTTPAWVRVAAVVALLAMLAYVALLVL